MLAVSPIVLALNVANADERRKYIDAFAELVEHFGVKPVFERDSFVTIADVMPAVLAATAEA
jgi:hypothetical protein